MEFLSTYVNALAKRKGYSAIAGIVLIVPLSAYVHHDYIQSKDHQLGGLAIACGVIAIGLVAIVCCVIFRNPSVNPDSGSQKNSGVHNSPNSTASASDSGVAMNAVSHGNGHALNQLSGPGSTTIVNVGANTPTHLAHAVSDSAEVLPAPKRDSSAENIERMLGLMTAVHSILDTCRNIHVDAGHGSLTNERLLFQTICDELVAIIASTGQPLLSVTILYSDAAGFKVLARDKVTHKQCRDNNDGVTVYMPNKENSALFELCPNCDKNVRWYWNPDTRNPNTTQNVRSPYKCALPNWEEHIGSTLVVPIQTWQTPQNAVDSKHRLIAGFVIVDKKEANGFHEKLVGWTIAGFADNLYPVLLRIKDARESASRNITTAASTPSAGKSRGGKKGQRGQRHNN